MTLNIEIQAFILVKITNQIVVQHRDVNIIKGFTILSPYALDIQ